MHHVWILVFMILSWVINLKETWEVISVLIPFRGLLFPPIFYGDLSSKIKSDSNFSISALLSRLYKAFHLGLMETRAAFLDLYFVCYTEWSYVITMAAQLPQTRLGPAVPGHQLWAEWRAREGLAPSSGRSGGGHLMWLLMSLAGGHVLSFFLEIFRKILMVHPQLSGSRFFGADLRTRGTSPRAPSVESSWSPDRGNQEERSSRVSLRKLQESWGQMEGFPNATELEWGFWGPRCPR